MQGHIIVVFLTLFYAVPTTTTKPSQNGKTEGGW